MPNRRRRHLHENKTNRASALCQQDNPGLSPLFCKCTFYKGCARTLHGLLTRLPFTFGRLLRAPRAGPTPHFFVNVIILNQLLLRVGKRCRSKRFTAAALRNRFPNEKTARTRLPDAFNNYLTRVKRLIITRVIGGRAHIRGCTARQARGKESFPMIPLIRGLISYTSESNTRVAVLRTVTVSHRDADYRLVAVP